MVPAAHLVFAAVANRLARQQIALVQAGKQLHHALLVMARALRVGAA